MNFVPDIMQDNWGYEAGGDLRRWTFPGLDFQLAFMDTSYFPATSHGMDQIAGGIVHSQPILNRRFYGSACEADDVTTGNYAGPTIGSLVIYERTERVPIAYIGRACGIPLVSCGGKVIINWDRGINKIMRLGANGRVPPYEPRNVIRPPSLIEKFFG